MVQTVTYSSSDPAGNNRILFPLLEDTIHRSSVAQWADSQEASGASSAGASALVCDTIYTVLPVALCRHFAEGPLMKSYRLI